MAVEAPELDQGRAMVGSAVGAVRAPGWAAGWARVREWDSALALGQEGDWDLAWAPALERGWE